MSRTAAIIVAAGRGVRAGGEVPKQWRDLAGEPVAWHAMQAFARHPRIDRLVLVLHPDDYDPDDHDNGLWPSDPPADIVTGGATRAASVLAGLEVVEGDVDKVLIHDAARPCVSAQIIDDVLDALDTHCAAAPALAVIDALWTGADGLVSGVQTREGLFRAQTPQGFRTEAIIAAHRAAPDAEAVDDVALARAAGLEVCIVPGHEDNLKITYPGDFARAERILERRMDIRLGNGFDVHRFGPGDQVWLCGVSVPHARGLQGHSDADVGMHAVTDALYGALAEGDIGRHFPPSDPQWKGAESHIFLTHAATLAREYGFEISNIDCTLICESPKIGPHAPEMQARMADILGIGPNRVSIKATTSERLGFTGREEGIAALATATLVKT